MSLDVLNINLVIIITVITASIFIHNIIIDILIIIPTVYIKLRKRQMILMLHPMYVRISSDKASAADI